MVLYPYGGFFERVEKFRRVIYLAFVTWVDYLVLPLSERVSFLCYLFLSVTFFTSTHIQWEKRECLIETKSVMSQIMLDS